MPELTRDVWFEGIATAISGYGGHCTRDCARLTGCSIRTFIKYARLMEKEGLVKSLDYGFGSHSDSRWFLVSDFEFRLSAPLREMMQWIEKRCDEINQDGMAIQYGTRESDVHYARWRTMHETLHEAQRILYSLEVAMNKEENVELAKKLINQDHGASNYVPF